MFDPDAPAISPNLEGWHEQMKAINAAADLEGSPKVEIQSRHKNLLEALGMLASISGKNGLREVTTNSALAEVHTDRARGYPGDVFDRIIVPRSKNKRARMIRGIEPVLSRMFGPVEEAYLYAWSDLTPRERALMLIDNPGQYPDQEEMSVSFRAKYGGKEGAQPRKSYISQLSGKKSKQKAA